jgi:hypothetical protein
LDKPDTAPTVLPLEERFTPNILVDRVTYDDVAPWPTSPDGTGQSLTRTSSTAFGDFAASWTGSNPTPGSIAPPSSAPRVTGVILSGTTWTAAFKDAVSTVGSPVQGYSVPKGSGQATVLPWERVNQVSITFDRAVTISTGALTVRGVNTPSYSVAPTPSNPAGFTYTWTINTPVTGDRLILDLDDGKVNAAGLMLDGEWTDNVSPGSSGNGTAGGDFRFKVNILPGDVDGDGDVQNDDFVDVRLAMFSTAGGGSYDVRRDLVASGIINFVDAIAARNNLNRTLPAGTPSSPAAPDAIVAVANRSSRRGDAAGVRAVARATAVDRVLSGSLSVSGLSGGDADADAADATTLRVRRPLRGR